MHVRDDRQAERGTDFLENRKRTVEAQAALAR
jgi:hypothetical protein